MKGLDHAVCQAAHCRHAEVCGISGHDLYCLGELLPRSHLKSSRPSTQPTVKLLVGLDRSQNFSGHP